MKKKDFDNLVASIEEGGRIRRGHDEIVPEDIDAVLEVEPRRQLPLEGGVREAAQLAQAA